ncbi:MAG: NAD(P)-binding domain-containing protein, partial [Bacteroidota bacterium]|nr:NAD(P)-binding domain-containing protein [Bacteroidota bacterium]
MKTIVYSAHKFEREYLVNANDNRHDMILHEVNLSENTVHLAAGCVAASIFVTDPAPAGTIQKLAALGIRYLALRSAGYNHVDLKEAERVNIGVARVPSYSPYAVAEHTVAMMLALNRQLVHAHNRINELNFSLDGLTGFDMHGKVAGIIGTGQIGSLIVKILHGFGCTILAHDTNENASLIKDYGLKYVDNNTLCEQSDIISLHVPLKDDTKHIINAELIHKMKRGVMLINT